MSQKKDLKLRNVCIIAHVDHGKTTLVDGLLQQSGLFQKHEKTTERVMDSNELEIERGITILSKNTSIRYDNHKLNIVDTPGHADFGGEVERILGTVDGAILLVDAVEGPLPQTRFVLEKAFEKDLKVVLCINKVDRNEVRDDLSRIEKVVDEVFELFLELGASDEQLDFPIIYASARSGWCTKEFSEISDLVSGEKKGNLKPLFDLFLNFIPSPRIEEGDEFKMQLSSLSWSDYLGQLAIGRVVSGSVKKLDTVFRIRPGGGEKAISRFTVAKILTYEGLQQKEVECLNAGEIGILSGCKDIMIGDTIAGNEEATPFTAIAIDPPTLRMIFTVNTSPFSGKDGLAIQSRNLRERLMRECRSNIAFQLEDGESSEQFYLLGRGELQFSILIETMRREGLEFMVGRPTVMTKIDEDGKKLEPIESAVFNFPEEHSGDVTSLFQERKGVLEAYDKNDQNWVQLTFAIPTRGLIGTRSTFLTLTRGYGLSSSRLKCYEPYKGDLLVRKNGTLISDRSGKTTDYALASIEERGILFVKTATEVYEGMIIGENNRQNDMNVNAIRPKKLTNVRSTSSDGIVMLSGTRDMSLEQCIEWIDEDEWIECTPKHIRLRKKELQSNKRSVIRK